MRLSRVLPAVVLMAAPGFGCCFPAKVEQEEAARPLTFANAKGPELAAGDSATGHFTADGKRTELRHAYVVIEKPKPAEPVEEGKKRRKPKARPFMTLRLSDVPLPTRNGMLLDNLAEAGEARYLEAEVDKTGQLLSVRLCNKDVKTTCIPTYEWGERTVLLELGTQDGPHVTGRLYTKEPRKMFEVEYSFSGEFKATPWEHTGGHLGLEPDGSFGVQPGKAAGRLTFGSEILDLAYSYAQPREGGGTDVVLTSKPLPGHVLEITAPLSQKLALAEMPGMHVSLTADGAPYSVYWRGLKSRAAACTAEEGTIGLAAGPDNGPLAVAATVYSLAPATCSDVPYEFRATFSASIASGS